MNNQEDIDKIMKEITEADGNVKFIEDPLDDSPKFVPFSLVDIFKAIWKGD